MDDPYTLSSTRARMGGMEAAELAGSATMSNIYDRVQKDYQIDRPRGASSYVPPSFRQQITAEELEMKRANLQTRRAEFEMNRANALMINEESKLNHQIKVQEQVGPATQALYEIDPASPNAFSEIREVQKTYPLAFEDNAFLQSSVNPLIEVHNRYMEDVPKPKTSEEIMDEAIKIRAKQQEILNMFGAKSLDDLRKKGSPTDVRLYEMLNLQLDELIPPQAPQQVVPPPAQGATQQQGGGGALGWLKGIIGE